MNTRSYARPVLHRWKGDPRPPTIPRNPKSSPWSRSSRTSSRARHRAALALSTYVRNAACTVAGTVGPVAVESAGASASRQGQPVPSLYTSVCRSLPGRGCGSRSADPLMLSLLEDSWKFSASAEGSLRKRLSSNQLYFNLCYLSIMLCLPERVQGHLLGHKPDQTGFAISAAGSPQCRSEIPGLSHLT